MPKGTRVNTEELLDSMDAKLTKLNPPEEIQPERIRPVAIMTRERRQLGDLEKEFQQVLDSIKYNARVPGLVTRLADMHLQEATYGRAIILYEISLGLASEQVGAWTRMGLAYLMVGEPKDAISCLGSALAIEPDNTLALVYLANAQLLLGDLEKCNENLDRVLQLDASMSRAMLVKGKYFRENGEPDVAVTWLRRAIAMNPQFLPALMELGSVYLSLKKYKEAIEALNTAVGFDPEQAYALATLGDVYLQQQDLESALHYYDKAVSIKFDDPELWIKKGDIHKFLKSYQQASSAYQKAINANPEHVNAWVRNGSVMLLLNDEGTALEYLNTALALEPKNAEVAHQRGLIFYSLEKHEEALADFDTAFSVDPSNPIHLYYRALMLEILKRNKAAKRTWHVAIKLFEEMGDETKVAECTARMKRL